MAIWPFKKKPTAEGLETQDAALESLSQMFVSCPSKPTPCSDSLDPSKFDFTVESLAAMDAHLEHVRSVGLSPDDRLVFILRSGAYVGEVIRRSTTDTQTWSWLAYKQAATLSPFVASLGMHVESSAVLWDNAGGFIFPLAKVSKYLENGAEDSVLFYAKVIIAGPHPAT